MKLTTDDVELLRGALTVCRIIGVDAIVINEGQIRGCTPSMKGAILTKTAIKVDPTLNLGLSRLSELEKRLSIFSGPVTIEGKMSDNGVDVSQLTLASSGSKVQFRCTKSTLIKYPKANNDEQALTVVMTKAEANQLTRALKSLKSETAVLKVGRDGVAGFEAIDSTNDRFSMDLEKQVDFENEPAPTVLTYEADRFATIIDSAAHDADEIHLRIGEFGSITLVVKGHTVLIMPHVTGEEEDDE